MKCLPGTCRRFHTDGRIRCDDGHCAYDEPAPQPVEPSQIDFLEAALTAAQAEAARLRNRITLLEDESRLDQEIRDEDKVTIEGLRKQLAAAQKDAER